MNSLDLPWQRSGVSRSLKRSWRDPSTSRLLWTCSWPGSSLLSSPGIEPHRLELWLLLHKRNGLLERWYLLLERSSLELLELLTLGLGLLNTPARPRLPRTRHMPNTS